jgi:hypothetical protein
MQPIRRYEYDKLGQDPNDPLGNLVKAARDTVCTGTDPSNFPSNDPWNWLRAGVRAGWGCPLSPGNQNSPQQITDPKGKCVGIRYRVTLSGTYESKQGTNWNPVNVSRVTEVWGAIGAISRTIDSTGNQWIYTATVGANASGTPQPNTELFRAFANKDGTVRNANYSIDIVPANPSQPDSCQNPAPTYPTPPTRPTLPPSFPRINIPPVIVVPIKPSVNIKVDARVNITANGTVNLKLADAINLQFGPSGIDVYINPDSGIDIYPDSPSPGYELPPGTPDPPTGNNGSEGTDGDCPDVDLDPVIDKLNQLLDCACDDDGEFNTIVVPVLSGNSGSIVLNDNDIAVKVALIEVPDNPKIEWGGGSAPDVYYAGWTSFSSFDGQRDRTPIDYLSKVYFRKEGDTFFTWTCRQFYSASVSVVRRLV